MNKIGKVDFLNARIKELEKENCFPRGMLGLWTLLAGYT